MKLRTGFSKIPLPEVIIMLILTWIMGTIFVALFSSLFPSLSTSLELMLFLSEYILKPFVVVYLLLRVKSEGFSSDKLLKDEFTSIPFEESIADICVLFCLNQIMLYSNIILMNYFNLEITTPETSNQFTSNSSLLLTLVSTLGLMFIAPITEEIFFRGWILNRLLAGKSVLISAFITSILFAILHGPGRVISIFMGGMILAILYLKYQNIGVPIILHIFQNALGSLLYDFIGVDKLIDWISSLSSQPGIGMIILFLSSVFYIGCIGAMIYFMKKNWPNANQVKFFDTSEVKFD
ncbi:MAG: type II CAAX endopeptidase family protein [Gallicola sp.]|nr:type II CAAX endopeptidase family protein [Gallicola sp.]